MAMPIVRRWLGAWLMGFGMPSRWGWLVAGAGTTAVFAARDSDTPATATFSPVCSFGHVSTFAKDFAICHSGYQGGKSCNINRSEVEKSQPIERPIYRRRPR